MSSLPEEDRPDIERLIANLVRAASKVQWCRARWEPDDQASQEEAAAVAALRAAFEQEAASTRTAAPRVPRPALPAAGNESALEVRCEGSQLMEVVGRGKVHLAPMSNNHWWMVLEAEGQRVDVWLHASGRITATFETDETPEPSPAK
jgi:hypothetical protein